MGRSAAHWQEHHTTVYEVCVVLVLDHTPHNGLPHVALNLSLCLELHSDVAAHVHATIYLVNTWFQPQQSSHPWHDEHFHVQV